MKTALVTGAAGFIGAHLSRSLLEDGWQVVGVDNFYSSVRTTIEELQKTFTCRFHFIEHDVRHPLTVTMLPAGQREIQEIYHLACPASPPRYGKDPLFTLDTSIAGMRHCLDLARELRARLLFTSTSEVYGDPEQHPQSETYRGAVNTWGPRACYDEGKRAAETLCYLYENFFNVTLRVARIFNTYGPGMDPEDGRVITNFFGAAKQGKPYPIFGDGKQTRSFCFIADMVAGLIRLCRSEVLGPLNLGNPQEVNMLDLARTVHRIAGKGDFKVVHHPLPQDDPQRRCPNIDRASQELGWSPKVPLEEGLRRFITRA